MFFQPCLFSVPEISIPDAYGTKDQHRKPGARKWSRFMAPVSEVRVMGLNAM